MLESFLSLLYRRRTITLLGALLALVVAAFFASRLSVNDSPERWLPASSVEDWYRFSEHYEYADTIAVALQFDREVRDSDLELLKKVRSDLLDVKGIKQVIDLSLMAEEIEGVPLTALLKHPKGGEEDPYEMYRGILFDDPGRQRDAQATDASDHANPAGRTLLDFVLLETATTEGLDDRGRQQELDQRRRRVVDDAYQVLRKHQKYDRDDVRYHMVGGIVIQYELEKIAGRLVRTIVPLSLLLTLLALGVGFRSLPAVAIAVLGGLWSVTVMLGGVALAGWTLNVVTVGGPTLMVVIVVATTVHFSHYYSVRGHLSDTSPSPAQQHTAPKEDGTQTRLDAKAHFVRWVALPCLGAAVVTGVGFLMLAFNELGPARELGIELFAGAMLAFLGAFLMWMLLHPFRAARGFVLSSERLRRLQQVLVRRPRATTAAIVVALLPLAYTARWVKVDIDPYAFFQPESRITKALDHFAQRKFGLYVVDVVLIPKHSPEDPGERAAARRVDRKVALEFQRQIQRRKEAEVRKTISTMNVRERSPQVSPGSKPWEWTWWKDRIRRSEYDRAFKDWIEDLSGQGALRISFMVYDPGTGFRPLVDAVDHALPRERFDCIRTGTAVHTVELSEGLLGGITRGLGVALVVMSLLCAVLFRSVRLTLIAFLPNALPVLVIFGVMGTFGVPLNSGSAMVTTVALGVALNDTIHFVMHYRRRRLEGADTEGALSDTFGEVGRPIVLTSVVNCLGFAIFMLSDFRPMFHFGMLASIAMAAALVGDLVLLPNLIRLFDRKMVNNDT